MGKEGCIVEVSQEPHTFRTTLEPWKRQQTRDRHTPRDAQSVHKKHLLRLCHLLVVQPGNIIKVMAKSRAAIVGS
ncbi:hypothetical protein ACJ73_06279, partial [Blastomyces percursus]